MEIDKIAIIVQDSARNNEVAMTRWTSEQRLRQEAAVDQINERMRLQLQAWEDSHHQKVFELLQESISEPGAANPSSQAASSTSSVTIHAAQRTSYPPRRNGERQTQNYGVRFSATQYEIVHCPTRCDCSCHKISKLKTPSFLQSVLGSLNIGYSQVPILSRCDI
jgi:hypothetical protein